MDGFHVQGMTENELDPFLAAKIVQPIPGEHTFHSDHQTFPERGNIPDEFIRIAVNVAMEQNFSFAIKNAEIHFSGMKIDSAVMFVCFSVKSHFRPPFGIWFSLSQAYKKMYAQGGA
jgi:hypothetical protein